MQNLVNSKTVSMSLREIAEVLNSNPSNLIKSAEKLVNAGVISFLPVELASLKVIKIDQRLNRIDSITLTAQNNPAYTKAIVERLDQMERGQPTVVLDARILALQLSREALETSKAFGFTGNQALLSADKATKALTGYSPLQLMGQTLLPAEDNEQTLTATELGKLMDEQISAIMVNRLLAYKGLQQRVGKLWVITELGDEYCVKLDTGKKYSDGTPIQQIKWKKKTLKLIN